MIEKDRQIAKNFDLNVTFVAYLLLNNA